MSVLRAAVETLEQRFLLSISGAQPVSFTATVGAPFSGPVATFTDSYYGATASDYSIFIAYSANSKMFSLL